MPIDDRSAAERKLRVPIRDEYWDTLYAEALERRMEAWAWASVILERHIQRRQRKLLAAKAAA